MKEISRNEKIFFAAVGLLALWVGVWGCFIPTNVDMALPWLVPPLHARFLGVMYLSGVILTVAGLLSRWYAEVRIIVRVIALWTGLLLVISLLHLNTFNFNYITVRSWFMAYLVYPLMALWLMWRDRGPHQARSGPSIPSWARAYLLLQGIVFCALALLLLFTPNFMSGVWPWKISAMLAQMYSSPFLSYGLSSIMLSRRTAWLEVRIMVLVILVFALGSLVVSLVHRGLFSATNPATFVWFAGFLVIAAMLGALTLSCLRDARGARWVRHGEQPRPLRAPSGLPGTHPDQPCAARGNCWGHHQKYSQDA
jgi:hypothetical protein